jgi:hypothetical protein
MPAKLRAIEDRYQSESRYTITGAFCLGWSVTSDQLAGARRGAGDAASHLLPTLLVNRIQSHIPGACSP